MPNWTYEDKNGTRLTFESDLQPSPDIVPTLFENYYSSQRDIGGYVSETLAAVPRGFANSFLQDSSVIFEASSLDIPLKFISIYLPILTESIFFIPIESFFFFITSFWPWVATKVSFLSSRQS